MKFCLQCHYTPTPSRCDTHATEALPFHKINSPTFTRLSDWTLALKEENTVILFGNKHNKICSNDADWEIRMYIRKNSAKIVGLVKSGRVW
jgi:hypothetical protein